MGNSSGLALTPGIPHRATSSRSRPRRWIWGIDFRHDLLPDFQIAKFACPAFDLCAVHAITGDSQDSRDVAQMTIAAALGKVPEFAQVPWKPAQSQQK